MTGSSSSGTTQELHDEIVPDQRFTRRQVAYSLSAFVAALVVVAFGIAFAYQSVDDSNSPHVHAAESDIHSHQGVGHDVDEDMSGELTSPGETHDEPALDASAGHEPQVDESDEQGQGTNE